MCCLDETEADRAKTPVIHSWLATNKPDVLRQVENAIRPVPGNDAVSVATALLAQRLDNIGANFGLYPGCHVQAETCNGHGHVRCAMRSAGAAKAFCDFAKVFLHPSASVEETGPADARRVYVTFHIDENSA